MMDMHTSIDGYVFQERTRSVVNEDVACYVACLL